MYRLNGVRSLRLLSLGLVVGWFLVGCSKNKSATTEDPLAQVFDKTLYPSDIEGIVGANVSSKDSTLIVQSYIENWAKEQLIIAIAEQNIPKDSDINKSVEDYRKSLVRHFYEEKLIEQRLDSVVEPAEIERYYRQVKDRYQLDKTIVRCYFMKIPDDAPDAEMVKNWWNLKKQEDKQRLSDYCRKYSDRFLLDDSTWTDSELLIGEFPNNTLLESWLKKGYRQITRHGGHTYYLLINEVSSKNQTAPLSYVRSQIIITILRKRKLELLENMTDELYQRELNKKNVKIFTQ